MRLQSPLSNLCEVLAQIQESANLYKATLTRNEAATRAVLIDPILRALGWDTANTNMVEVEKTIDSVRADYALYDSNAIARIIVEAKSLGSRLDDRKVLMSLVNYAFNFELEDIFLTDGLVWMHYDHFQPGQLEPSGTFNIAEDDPVKIASYLVQHLDAAKYWPVDEGIDVLSQRVEELEGTLAGLQRNLANMASELAGLKGVQPSTVEEKVVSSPESKLDFVELDQLEDIAGKKPSHFRLPDGTVVEITTWKDVLRESCLFAMEHAPDIALPLPDRVGKKVYLFSQEKPRKGVSFFTTMYQRKTIYVYSNYDSKNCVANAMYVLRLVSDDRNKIIPAVVFN